MEVNKLGQIGGGALFVPILMIFFQVTTKQAIALSNALIFFNSSTKYFATLYDKDPLNPWRPQVDYNIALIFNPMIQVLSFNKLVDKKF